MKALKISDNNPAQNQFTFTVNTKTNNNLGEHKVLPIGNALLKLNIKNMVSFRCIMVVKAILEQLGIQFITVELGEAIISEHISTALRAQLKIALQNVGLELLEDPKSILIEKIKKVIVEMVHYDDEPPKTKISDYLSSKFHLDYTYISNLFTAATHTNIQHYIINQKIEKAKELLMYGELTLTEISYKLHYSSVAHLSNQFKRATGMSPSCFKLEQQKKRVGWESV